MLKVMASCKAKYNVYLAKISEVDRKRIINYSGSSLITTVILGGVGQ